MNKKTFFISVIVVFSLGTLIFFGEVFLRLRRHELLDFDNYFVKFRKTKAATCLVTFDETLGWVSESNVTERRNNYRTRVTTRDHGIRINSVQNKVDSKLPPILAVGDSFVFGDQASNEESWPSHLEAKSGTRVLNAGMCGYGMDQSYLRAKQLVDIYQPSTLIYSFTSYDIPRSRDKFIADTFADDPKPYFETENGVFELKGVPLPKPKDIHEMNLPFLHRVVGKSAFFSFLMERLAPNYWWSIKLPDRKVASTHDEPEAVSCHIVKLISEMSREKNIRTILLPQPFYELDPADGQVLEKVVACAKENSLEVLDITEALREAKSNRKAEFDTFYFSYPNSDGTVGHGHMTNAGNNFVAEQIHNYLNPKVTQN